MVNVIIYRTEKENFLESFRIRLSTHYQSEKVDLTIITCGPMVAEAIQAAYILKEEYGLNTRILNIHSLKPIDKKVIIKAADKTNIIITIEEHQVGGFDTL